MGPVALEEHAGETQAMLGWVSVRWAGQSLVRSWLGGSLLDSVFHAVVVWWRGVTLSCVGALAGPFLLELMMVFDGIAKRRRACRYWYW